MKYTKIEIGRNETGNQIGCLCLNYDQFVLDANILTDTRFDGFRINPNERFQDKIGKVLFEILNNERTLPSRFVMRLESRYAICNCRIDYSFEVMDKDFFKENIRAKEIPVEVLKECLNEDVDCIILYAGMNK